MMTDLRKATAPEVIAHLEVISQRCGEMISMLRKYPILVGKAKADSCLPSYERRHASTVRRLIKFKRWYREHPKHTLEDVQAVLIALDIPRTDEEIAAKIRAINEDIDKQKM